MLCLLYILQSPDTRVHKGGQAAEGGLTPFAKAADDHHLCIGAWKANAKTSAPAPESLNPIFRPRHPSKQVGDVFKCLSVFCIELAYGNGCNYCAIDKIPPPKWFLI